ncbi:MAG TPA: SRPBCC domain-containing protein [Actinomycetota bacterium]|nr:SRPBCC domain-containing protein [Actinomycetota bacterium]
MDDITVREVRITRLFDAPRELVWAAWTEPAKLARWCMPKGFSVPRCEVDLRPGGKIRMTVLFPDGSEMEDGGEIVELDPPERLVMTSSSFEGPDGVPLLEVLNTVTFTAIGDRTEIDLHAVVTRATPDMSAPLAGMEEGWLESLEKLDMVLAGRDPEAASSEHREIGTSRVLDAPIAAVWKAWTDPGQVATWWGPKGFTTTVEEMDVRPGGVWRLTMHGPDGTDYPHVATFLDVRENDCIAYAQGAPGSRDRFFAIVEMVDEGGKTRLTSRMLFPSAAERDRHAEEFGAVEGLESHLDELAGFLAERG